MADVLGLKESIDEGLLVFGVDGCAVDEVVVLDVETVGQVVLDYVGDLFV